MGESRMLDDLKAKLCRLGYDVQDVEPGIFVRLPLECGVQVLQEGQICKTVPRCRYGWIFVRRWVTTLLVSVGLAVLAVAGLFFNDNFHLLWYILIAAALVLSHICQYILTESAITRIQYLVANDASFMNQGEVV